MVIIFSGIKINVAAEGKFSIQITNNSGGEDSTKSILTNLFIYDIKEGIRKSSIMKIYNPNKDKYKIVIYMMTIPKYENNPDSAIIYSVVWRYESNDYDKSIYIGATLGYCGNQVYKEYAKNLVVYTDQLVNNEGVKEYIGLNKKVNIFEGLKLEDTE